MPRVRCQRCGNTRDIPLWQKGDVCQLRALSPEERLQQRHPYAPTRGGRTEICGGELKKVARELPKIGAILKPRNLDHFVVIEHQVIDGDNAERRLNGSWPRFWGNKAIVYSANDSAVFALQKVGGDEFQVLEIQTRL